MGVQLIETPYDREPKRKESHSIPFPSIDPQYLNISLLLTPKRSCEGKIFMFGFFS